MVIPDEHNPALIKPTNVKGSEMGSRKFGVEIRHNRGALSVINQNLVVAQPYPCVVNKRVLSNQKFAAQLVNTQEEACQETKKARPPVVDNFTIWEDYTITDVNEQETGADQHVAMILEQTEEFISGKEDQMEEVEMEDIFEEPVLNIDSCDAKNPLAVVEYVDDLYAYYRKMESSTCASPNYMEQQFDINEKMRSILIDWLIEVHHKFDLNEETLFLTVNIIDRFLSNQGVVRKKLQLVGLVAMLLACKYEEVSIPIVEDLIFISDKAYTRTEVLEMERLILMTLQFNMSVPTPYVFMKRFLKAAQSDRKLELLSFYLIELCLVEYEMLKFPPSFLAAAVVYTAQCSLYGIKQWTKTCEWHTNYCEDQLLECSKMIVSFHQKASTGRLTGVHRKYSTYKFGYVSKTEPAHFLMVETSTTIRDSS